MKIDVLPFGDAVLKNFSPRYYSTMKNLFQSNHNPRGPVFARISVPKDADPSEKGYAFEQFVVSMFDHEMYFKLLEWRSDKCYGRIRPRSCKYPDLELEYEFKGIRTSELLSLFYANGFQRNTLDTSLRLANSAFS
jgi:hypothetical protein